MKKEFNMSDLRNEILSGEGEEKREQEKLVAGRCSGAVQR